MVHEEWGDSQDSIGNENKENRSKLCKHNLIVVLYLILS